jgi:hypothetical protein
VRATGIGGWAPRAAGSTGLPPSARLGALLALALLAAAAFAQDQALERVELRVTSASGAEVTIDRGKTDGLAVGDRVLFYPVGGGTYTGSVLRADERSATVEMHDRTFTPAPGTRGEVLVPVERIAREEKQEQEAQEEKKPVPDHPPWENKDEGFTKDQPLLSKVKPVRPEERPRKLSGTAYLVSQYINGSDADLNSMLVRGGVNALWSNVWKGDIHVNAELDWFTNVDDDEDLNLLVRWLSYSRGGDRFSPSAWQVGRFPQTGIPEFLYLDGFEWGHRRSNGHRYGASVGFMPEPDQDFETFSDFQLAGYYQWVSGPAEDLTIAAGFQQTWHNGDADRDLLVLKVVQLPVKGWDFNATAWIDFYTGKDDLKDGVDLTQLIAQINRRLPSGSGYNLAYQHLAFPDIQRQGEFTPPQDAEIADDRMDLLALNGWWQMRETVQLNGHLSGWIDQQDEGGEAELGIRVNDLGLRNSRFELAGYGGIGQYEDYAGARISYGHYESRGFWEVFYDYSFHHEHAFPDNVDDIQQHRFRVSGGLYLPSRWDITFYAETRVWDTEFTWVLGLALQKSF